MKKILLVLLVASSSLLVGCSSAISIKSSNFSAPEYIFSGLLNMEYNYGNNYSHITVKNENGEIIFDEVGVFEGKEKKGKFIYKNLTTGVESSVDLDGNIISIKELTKEEYLNYNEQNKTGDD